MDYRSLGLIAAALLGTVAAHGQDRQANALARGSWNGVDWLLQHRRDLVDAEFVINHDGYSVVTHHGKLL
jgi:hypothetical protein